MQHGSKGADFFHPYQIGLFAAGVGKVFTNMIANLYAQLAQLSVYHLLEQYGTTTTTGTGLGGSLDTGY
jgi:hypothetical protein